MSNESRTEQHALDSHPTHQLIPHAHRTSITHPPPTQAVTQYFVRFQPESVPYGFLPELPELLTVREEIDQEHASQVSKVHT